MKSGLIRAKARSLRKGKGKQRLSEEMKRSDGEAGGDRKMRGECVEK